MVTAEIAATMPVIVAVLTIALTAVGAVTDQLRCVDAARTGARLLARGEEVGRVKTEVTRQAPAGADIDLWVGPSEVETVVTADVPALLELLGVRRSPHAAARALREGVP
jgi:hypothetical protein